MRDRTHCQPGWLPKGVLAAMHLLRRHTGEALMLCIAEEELLEDSMFAAGPTPAPIFETFWQGRLIPGARIDTLPFIEVCRSCARHLSCICQAGGSSVCPPERLQVPL